jgi:hypothetical protein
VLQPEVDRRAQLHRSLANPVQTDSSFAPQRLSHDVLSHRSIANTLASILNLANSEETNPLPQGIDTAASLANLVRLSLSFPHYSFRFDSPTFP